MELLNYFPTVMSSNIVSFIMPQLYQQQERDAAILARKQRTYALLDADEEDVVEERSSGDPKETEKRKKRFRKKNEYQEDEVDEKVRDMKLYIYILF